MRRLSPLLQAPSGAARTLLRAGGESGGTHTMDEWYSNEGGPEGIERALLIVLEVAGIA